MILPAMIRSPLRIVLLQTAMMTACLYAPAFTQVSAPGTGGPKTGESNAQQAQPSPESNFPLRLFSLNKAKGVSPVDWNVLTRHSDLVTGLDEHGYTFPGLLDDFRLAAPDTPVYAFITSMGIQRSSINDWRFCYLDHFENAFLHSADPASLAVAVIGNETRLFWMRDHRRTASTWYLNPIGVTEYIIESAAVKNGPWFQEGAPIADDPGEAMYTAVVSSVATDRWYRVRTLLADATDYTDYSWPTQPAAGVAGFAYLMTGPGTSFTAGMWGDGPANAGDVVIEWGNLNGWGYASHAVTKSALVNGITEYIGELTSWPSSGAWVVRLRSVPQGIASMKFDHQRRNNRMISKFGEYLFKPDHANALTMHRIRLEAARGEGLTGMRLDFVLDSWPSWYVATAPQGEDAAYVSIEPPMSAMLDYLKANVPQLELVLNGISVTYHYTGIFDYTPPASGVDCEFLGYSAPGATVPFREYDMLDGVIEAAHHRDLLVTSYSAVEETDADARMTSLARYWLVYRPTVYYQCITQSNHQSVDYFPEVDIDMGRPVKARLDSRTDLLSGNIYRRDFAKGVAIYNPNTYSVSVPLGDAYYLVSPQGGHSPKQGGNGTVTFVGPVTSTVLAAKRGAVLVREPGLGR
jgi:hypothetical protein